MKKRQAVFCFAILFMISMLAFTILSGESSVAQAQGDYVYLGGYPIGISATEEGLIVVDVVAVQTENGEFFPLQNAGVAKGDILLSINGEKLTNVYQLKKLLCDSEGDVDLSVKHKSGAVCRYSVCPAVCLSKERKLGVIVKEDVSGIGTMTFVTLDKRFAALGHHIHDGESGLCDSLNSGKIYCTEIDGVIRGESGKAGGLVASLNKLTTPIGEIQSNTNIGIYGRFDGKIRGNLVRVAKRGEATMGKAQIYTTVEGENPAFYDIEIVKIVDQDSPKEKGLIIVVRDERLIAKTGGLVQGMSGSPIIQDGLLVGAVTHVFVGDATRGYGVHSRFMYSTSYMPNLAEERAAA